MVSVFAELVHINEALLTRKKLRIINLKKHAIRASYHIAYTECSKAAAQGGLRC